MIHHDLCDSIGDILHVSFLRQFLLKVRSCHALLHLALALIYLGLLLGAEGQEVLESLSDDTLNIDPLGRGSLNLALKLVEQLFSPSGASLTPQRLLIGEAHRLVLRHCVKVVTCLGRCIRHKVTRP